MIGSRSNDNSKSPAETGGSLSEHEMLRSRTITLMNTRERVHVALPEASERRPAPQLMAHQARIMIEQTNEPATEQYAPAAPVATEYLSPVETTAPMPIAPEFPLDPAAAALQRVYDIHDEAA